MSANAKVDLRELVQKRLKNLDPSQATAGSEAICSRLLGEIDSAGIDTVMAYLGAGSELNIDPVIAVLLDSGIRIAVPQVAESGNTMRAVGLGSLEENHFTVDRFGIRVPRNTRGIDPDQLGMIIVPGVAYDPGGRRLGRGGGFYDRYLKTVPEPAIRVGVCFSVQIVATVPTDQHDERVHLVVTERDVHRVD